MSIILIGTLDHGYGIILLARGEGYSDMGVNFKEIKLSLPNIENCEEFKGRKLVHICEVCSKREILTPEEGYKAGWDYAPICTLLR